MLGRVIIGDIAATLVDLAMRKLVRVEAGGEDAAAGGDAAEGGGWRLSSLAESAPRHRADSLVRYEEVLLGGLSGTASLASLASTLPRTLDAAREAIVHDAVHRGWLKRLHHDERTDDGEALASHVRAFQRELRRLGNAGGAAAFAGPLLPWALHFGLADPGLDPLVAFAHDFAGTFAELAGWQRPQHTRPDDSEFYASTPAERTPGDSALLLFMGQV